MAEFQSRSFPEGMSAQVRTQMVDLLRKLSLAQRVALGAVALGAIAGIILLVTVVNKPTYGTLFSNLSPQDASKIVEKLKEQKILYELDNDGKTILIPKDKIYDTRLSLAGEGLPQSSLIGYEIFDRTNIGVTDFVQKVNYRRALEGEIARTILQLEEVEAARVHIVVPEKTIFKEDEKPTTASIVLKLRANKTLRKENVQGMVHLVASSVEGLEPSNVTILDSHGRMLSETEKPNSLSAKTSTQYELQQRVENYLAQKAQTMLEGIVGSGNARVQVTAELDFRQVERTLEQYDPDKTAVRSEQLSEEKTVTSDSVQPSTKSNSVTNYEVNKTIEHIVESVGGVRRLSVAAIVNGTRKEVEKDGQPAVEYQPRPQEEMGQLSEIVKRAVGFDVKRNDEVSVVNLPFGTEDTEGFLYKDSPGTGFRDVMEDDFYGKIFMLVAMLCAVIMLWILVSRFRPSPELEREILGEQINVVVGDESKLTPRAEVALLPPAEDLISQTAKLREERQRRIGEYIGRQPAQAGRLLKVWLAEG
jgi:flagellar M-ring protein FliF